MGPSPRRRGRRHPGAGPGDRVARQPASPWVVVNMVSSLDGATAIDGKSSVLGDDDDHELFRALRTAARRDPGRRGHRPGRELRPGDSSVRNASSGGRDLGLPDVPRIAVLTGRLDLEPDARLFSNPDQKPLILTGSGVRPGAARGLVRGGRDRGPRRPRGGGSRSTGSATSRWSSARVVPASIRNWPRWAGSMT